MNIFQPKPRINTDPGRRQDQYSLEFFNNGTWSLLKHPRTGTWVTYDEPLHAFQALVSLRPVPRPMRIVVVRSHTAPLVETIYDPASEEVYDPKNERGWWLTGV